ncbi:replication initiation factor domain-containing protein [Pectobacterium versatile]|uniref:replication initiation factor domain-containing protein n=1 Tax=Pectobacterium versatile TaxID=2488639 RepID=UPI001F207716|nr:replication initiation factor domain-containing protein [Pectobacterium versatile]
MLLNKNNIDTCSSLQIGKDKNGNPLKIRIDKLTVVSHFIRKEEKKKVYVKLKKMRQIKQGRYSITYIKNKEEMPYRSALLIKERKEYSPLLLRIDYSPINKKTGGIRLDFHPQYLTPKKIDRLLSWMNFQLGEILYHLLARAWITRIDVALDFYDRYLHDYIWELRRSGQPKYFNEENSFPGVQLGSNRSKIHMLCYEKLDVFKNKYKRYEKNNDLIEVNFNKYKKFLRIESRYMPNSKPTSKNGNPLMLKDILNMENPFTRLQVYSIDLANNFLEEGYILTIPPEPSTHALKCCIRRKMKYSRIPRHVHKIFKKHQIPLFDKHIIWQNWPICVNQLSGIFTVAFAYKDRGD